MARVSTVRRELARALRSGDMTLQVSLRSAPARHHFSTRTANWEINYATNTNKATWLLSPPRFPIHNAIPAFGRTRRFTSSPTLQHDHLEPPKPGEELKITFITKEGDRQTFDVKAGDNLLDIAIDNDLEMEGACGGSCACSTCHVIVEDEKFYDKMDEPDDDENDMLDLAFGLTETSRLGCQVKMTKELDGLVVRLPSMTRNLQASDFQS